MRKLCGVRHPRPGISPDRRLASLVGGDTDKPSYRNKTRPTRDAAVLLIGR